MRFTVTIECDNAAFEDNAHGEVRRILHGIIERLGSMRSSGACMDINGNKVGEWELGE